MILNLNDPFTSREGDRGGSSSPPLPWASPTKPPEVRKPRPFQPPLLNTLNLSSSASNSNSLLRRKENLIEKVKGSEMARENRKSGKENVELGTQEREASQGRQVLQKGKKKAGSVLSFEEEMETSSQRPGEASLKASKARPTRPSTGTWYSEQQVGFKYFGKLFFSFKLLIFKVKELRTKLCKAELDLSKFRSSRFVFSTFSTVKAKSRGCAHSI